MLGADVAELAARLAQRFGYPADGGRELTRVAQYVAVMKGSGPLYDELHDAARRRALPPTPLHRFFASLPPLLRERGVAAPAARDDELRPRARAGVPRRGRGVRRRLVHRRRPQPRPLLPHRARRRPGGRSRCRTRTRPSSRSSGARSSSSSTAGRSRRPQREWESFVVTEDDYIDYLAQTDVAGRGARRPRGEAAAQPLPLPRLHAWPTGTCASSSTGCGATSRSATARGRCSRRPKPLEREFWRRRDVDVLELPLEEYVEVLGRHAGRGAGGRGRMSTAALRRASPYKGLAPFERLGARRAALLRPRARARGRSSRTCSPPG